MKALTGNPEDVLPHIIRVIKQIVELKSTREFRIGRTSNLSERQQKYGFDKIIELYYTESNDRVKFTEGILIDTFEDYPKCMNTRRNGGPFSKEYGNFIYLGIWFHPK
jgi:hypothetical protein